MEKPAKSLAALLVGLGAGSVGGAYLGAAAIWPERAKAGRPARVS